MLSRDWSERTPKYDFVIVGSGYGGAILASRISGTLDNPRKTVWVLESLRPFFDKVAGMLAARDSSWLTGRSFQPLWR